MHTEFSVLKNYLSSNSALTTLEIEQISSYFQFKKLRRNQIIEREGEICKNMYFVVKGCLRLFEIDRKGTEVTVFFAFEDTFVSILSSFLLQTPSLDFMIAHEHSDVLVINHFNLMYIKDTFPAFAALYTKSVEFAFVHAQMRIYGFLKMNGVEKLKWVQEHEPHLLQRISSKAVASYLGLTNSTLSRLRRRLR